MNKEKLMQTDGRKVKININVTELIFLEEIQGIYLG